ncbi:MAG: insulinase family protein [Sedimentisphaerales bacterium]|nr:insulinase family protein [Sedimentisphaerales bacterium]
MKFEHKKLSNGLVLIGEINNSAKSSAVGFFVKTGSRDEIKQINGVSHFLEHMLFKGTEKLNAFEVNQSFDKTGAQFNAFTSEENTVFYAAVLPEYIVEVTGLWAELLRPALRDEDFNIEKNVIKEEIAMYKDLPSFDVVDRCRTLHFDGHPCSNSVLGSDESIDNLTAEQMRQYFSNRYCPNNMVLACAGNLDWAQICTITEHHCRLWEEQPVKRELAHSDGSKRKLRIEKENLVREHICLMNTGVSAQDPTRFAASLLGTITGDEVGSRYYWELVDKALAEAATMQFSAMDGTGAFYSYFRCSSENLDKVLDCADKIFQDLQEHGITEDELTKAKNKVLSALVIKNELPMGRLIDLGFNWIYLEQYRTIQDDINAIKAVSIDEVNTLIQKLNLRDFTQLTIGPVKK